MYMVPCSLMVLDLGSSRHGRLTGGHLFSGRLRSGKMGRGRMGWPLFDQEMDWDEGIEFHPAGGVNRLLNLVKHRFLDSYLRISGYCIFIIVCCMQLHLLTLKMHCTENLKQIFPEMKLCGLVTISAFMYQWAIYIFPQSVRKRDNAK